MASIALDRSDEDLTFELPWGEELSDLCSRHPSEGTRDGIERPAAHTMEQTLGSYRDVLGDLRADRLATCGLRLREEIREYDTAWVEERRRKLVDPLANLDRAGARETLRIEREKDNVNEQIAIAEADALEFEARVRETPARRIRERSALADAAHTHRELARRELDRLGELHDIEADLREDGRHLDG